MLLRRLPRSLVLGLTLPVVLLLGSAASSETRVGYLARQAYFQGELLWGRVPIEEARHTGGFTADQQARFDLVPEIQRFGAEIGLASSDNYTTINPEWDRTIYNLSASDPVSFRARTWSFPVVGTVPYLGFFRAEDAQARERKLTSEGWDVYVRTAGAYSTLGWFQDPLLPHMLGWSEDALANTLLHELAHATLWIPGSVQFNESYANFVGNEAELRYLASRYGEDSPRVRQELSKREDSDKYRQLLHEVYVTLDEVYEDPDLTRAEKLREKEVVLAALPTRIAELDLQHPEPYLRAARRGPWNNARLAQFRTYNSSHVYFAALLQREGGDLRAFVERLRVVTDGAEDPYAALVAYVGQDWVVKKF